MDNEMLNQLKITKFEYNSYRRIASNYKPCKSMTFGKTGLASRTWDSVKNVKYKDLYKMLLLYVEYLDPDHKFTSITVNKNFKTHPHYDSNNVGKSMIIALGDYEGGNLVVEGKSIDIRYKKYYFDGSLKLHWTEDFVGKRYSLVYFTRQS